MNQKLDSNTETLADFMMWIMPRLIPLRQAILLHAKENSCVVSTAIVSKVIRAAHGSAVVFQPVSVEALVINKPFAEQAQMYGGTKDIPRRLVDQWVKKYGAWSLGLGVSNDDGKYVGHLVGLALLSDGMVLIDMSLDQARRPEMSIVANPIAIRVWPDFVIEYEPIAVKLKNPQGAEHPHFFVSYRRSPYEDGQSMMWFVNSPDWTDKHGYHDKILEDYYGGGW